MVALELALIELDILTGTDEAIGAETGGDVDIDVRRWRSSLSEDSGVRGRAHRPDGRRGVAPSPRMRRGMLAGTVTDSRDHRGAPAGIDASG